MLKMLPHNLLVLCAVIMFAAQAGCASDKNEPAAANTPAPTQASEQPADETKPDESDDITADSPEFDDIAAEIRELPDNLFLKVFSTMDDDSFLPFAQKRLLEAEEADDFEAMESIVVRMDTEEYYTPPASLYTSEYLAVSIEDLVKEGGGVGFYWLEYMIKSAEKEDWPVYPTLPDAKYVAGHTIWANTGAGGYWYVGSVTPYYNDRYTRVMDLIRFEYLGTMTSSNFYLGGNCWIDDLKMYKLDITADDFILWKKLADFEEEGFEPCEELFFKEGFMAKKQPSFLVQGSIRYDVTEGLNAYGPGEYYATTRVTFTRTGGEDDPWLTREAEIYVFIEDDDGFHKISHPFFMHDFIYHNFEMYFKDYGGLLDISWSGTLKSAALCVESIDGEEFAIAEITFIKLPF